MGNLPQLMKQLPDMDSPDTEEGYSVKTQPALYYVIAVISICLYACTAIYIIIRGHYVGIRSFDLDIPDSTFYAPSAERRERGLDILEQAAPTKPFMIWWNSTRNERNYSGDNDQLFECTVCLESLLPMDPIHTLQCHHVFHSQCLENWYLTDHSYCPLCHKPFQTEHSATEIMV